MKLKAQEITWVAVMDGGKALIFKNLDTDRQPFLEVVDRREIDNPPTREQGTDRPGRLPDAGQGRSAVGATDWHEFAKESFARDMAALLNEAARVGAFDRLVIAAPDRVLGDVRPQLHGAAANRVIAEIHADLTNHPVLDIEKQVARAFA